MGMGSKDTEKKCDFELMNIFRKHDPNFAVDIAQGRIGYRNTPLMHACLKNNFKLIKWLTEAHANPCACSSENILLTPLLHCMNERKYTLCEYFLDNSTWFTKNYG